MSLNTKFDELFALRILFQDEYDNESDIIRELNYELIQRETSIENIPNYLKEFYESFGINMNIEEIKEILEPTAEEQIANQFINVLNQFVSGQLTNNNIYENNNNNNENNNENNNNNNENENNNDNENNNENENNNNNENNTEENIQDISNNSIQNIGNIGNTYLNSNIQFNFSNIVTGETTQYIINQENILHGHIINQNQNSSIILPIFSHLFSGLLLTDPISEDVVSTLDDSEKDKLKIYKLIEKKEEKCSICMSEQNIDEQVCELPCEHTFHDECIQNWLKNYNYKCPICRKEVGKPKHNI